MAMTKTSSSKDHGKHGHKEREYRDMRENLDKQREVIKTLREKERMLEEILEESHRT